MWHHYIQGWKTNNSHINPYNETSIIISTLLKCVYICNHFTYRVCPKSNVSESIKELLWIRSVQHIKRLQNRLLLRRYIDSSEISRHRRRHGRPPPECPLEPWCKPLWLRQLSQNDVLSWEFSSAETKRSLGSHVRTVGRLGNRWHLWIGQEAGHEEGGVGWRIVMVKFPIVRDVGPDAINPSFESL